jgi:hypothetical protein
MKPELEMLEGLKEPESELRSLGLRSNVNEVKSLQKDLLLLNERCRMLNNEKTVLKDNAAVLGRIANLMWEMTKTMVRYSYQDSEINDEDEMEALMDNLETLGEVAELMVDMSLVMAQVSAEE